MQGNKSVFRGVFAVLAAAALLAIVPGASASVLGTLDLANCTAGGVTVTTTSILWFPASGSSAGCVQTGSNTNVTFSGGTLGSGQTGAILDLTPADPLPVANFLTFSAAPALHFDLTSLGPGPSNTACSGALDPNAPVCAVFAGSPFILQSTATGTSVTLSATGTASDGTSPDSNWLGAFTTQIAGVSPAEIQASIVGGGSQTSTFSGDFVISLTSAVPEPATFGTMLLGGVLIALGRFRRKARS